MGEGVRAEIPDLDQLIAATIRKVYDEKIHAGDIDANLWKAQTEEYWNAIKEGWGKAPQFFDKAQVAMLELRRNVNVFSAFKNHANILELTQSLTRPDGSKLSFAEFRKLAKPISEKYYDSWLKAEYNYAQRAARSAAQWYSFKEGAMLEYKTIGDGRVRDAHRKLHGTILPVDHPFWSLYYPPNGWNCRCFVRERPSDTTAVPPGEIPTVSEMFQNNVGETGQIFDDRHPFIREIGAAQAQLIRWQAEHHTMQFERAFITDLATNKLAGKSVDVDSGAFQGAIGFTKKGIKKATNQPHANILQKNRAILNIQSLLKSSQYVGQVPGVDIAVKAFHYFAIEIDGAMSFIVVKELHSGEMVFYSIVDKLKG